MDEIRISVLILERISSSLPVGGIVSSDKIQHRDLTQKKSNWSQIGRVWGGRSRDSMTISDGISGQLQTC